MSSLKDIMDVDVEPFDSQTYRRSRDAAQPQASTRPSVASPSKTPSPLVDDEDDDKGVSLSTKRRRSSRASNLSSDACIPSSSSGPLSSTAHPRRNRSAREEMDYQPAFQDLNSVHGSASESPRVSSRVSELAADFPVKYTPVTGRISRARKGVPVHTCDVCRPVKTFTRAEHLRRHQLSHQKPAYPCTFEDCERAFHRPDLLARHLLRHETQGEKPYKSGDPRSRTSSIASDRLTPPLKVDAPPQPAHARGIQSSPGDSLTSHSSTNEPQRGASSYVPLPVNLSGESYTAGETSHKRSRSQGLPEPNSFGAVSPASAPSRSVSGNFELSASTGYGDATLHPRFERLYAAASTAEFTYPGTPQLHLLQIPVEPMMPGLSYTHESSPWCSSASSNCSTQSENSRGARYWTHGEDHSSSTATITEWPTSISVPHWSHRISTTPQDMRGPAFQDSMLEQYSDTSYNTSPRMTPSVPRQLLNVPNAAGYYQMETAVGTPTLPTYSKTFTQQALAPPAQFPDPGMGVDGRKKEFVDSPQLRHLSINTVITYQTQTQNLEIYLTSYFQHFHQFFPIIHRPTFDSNEDNLLSSAIAAIGTQYHATSGARELGSELNESCRKSIDLRLNWNTRTMQAIILTEIFTRFRGRKTNVRLSRHFEELYSRLLNGPISSQNLSADHYISMMPAGFQADWHHWIDHETRQRLLATCFMFDVHQAIYHEQARSKARRDDSSSELKLPCPESLWNAANTVEWQEHRSNYPSQPALAEQDISRRDVLDSSPFAQTLLVCSLAARLPKRDERSSPHDINLSSPNANLEDLMRYFPTSPLAHIYSALRHTPLHDLLAIAGDTWVFSQKINSPSAFHAAQSRLRIWSTSLAAAQATHHACRVLSSALSTDSGITEWPPTFERLTTGTLCICDYWSLYISALICWAFGNRYQAAALIARSGASALSTMDSDDLATTIDDPRPKALTYVNGMLGVDIEGYLTSKATLKGDTAAVIDAVRQRLEVENVGNNCSLLVDAVGVLGKIKAGGKVKWF